MEDQQLIDTNPTAFSIMQNRTSFSFHQIKILIIGVGIYCILNGFSLRYNFTENEHKKLSRNQLKRLKKRHLKGRLSNDGAKKNTKKPASRLDNSEAEPEAFEGLYRIEHPFFRLICLAAENNLLWIPKELHSSIFFIQSISHRRFFFNC